MQVTTEEGTELVQGNASCGAEYNSASFFSRVSMHSVQSAILFYHFRPSVFSARFGIVSKRMHMSSDFLHRIW